MANFDDLQGAVAQFGANNKVIFDDTGMPSIMVAVPKAKYSDVITGSHRGKRKLICLSKK